jgi:hypothetical protein
MIKARLVVVSALLLITAAAARAADDAPAGDPPLKMGFMKGVIVRVDGTDLIFKDKKGPEVTVATTDATQVTIDGKPATLADLKEGYAVQVTATKDTAEKIIAKTRKPQK